jgi:hypothetical protein
MSDKTEMPAGALLMPTATVNQCLDYPKAGRS